MCVNTAKLAMLYLPVLDLAMSTRLYFNPTLSNCKSAPLVIFRIIVFLFCVVWVCCLLCAVYMCCLLCAVYLCCVVGSMCGARRIRLRIARANCGFTNRRNKGLISVDRRTSLLSYLQYPVPYQSRLQRIYRISVPERRLNLVLGRSLSLRVNTESGEYRRFPA